jgi:hypothetical protein
MTMRYLSGKFASSWSISDSRFSHEPCPAASGSGMVVTCFSRADRFAAIVFALSAVR